MTAKYFAAFLIGMAAMLFAVFASQAFASDMQWKACGIHAGRYFCTEYVGIAKKTESQKTIGPCDTDPDDYCDSFHPPRVPLPRARPVIPCDTDSDCMAKNGGDGDPIAEQCFDPQEDETFGENGILCRFRFDQ